MGTAVSKLKSTGWGALKENPANENQNGNEDVNGKVNTNQNQDQIDTHNQREHVDSENASGDVGESSISRTEISKPQQEKRPEDLEKTCFGFEKFSIIPHSHKSHKFRGLTSSPKNKAEFHHAYQRELRLLQDGLPDGIFVKGYEDRMDLFSALILGPEGTPYEGGLFAFDIQLPNDYPRRPPRFYFISFSTTQLNPNLYAACGTVCVSLLGTWFAENKSERWNSQSSLLQVLVSIQGLILVPQPYFNEPGHLKEVNDPAVTQLSRDYNEIVVIHLLKSMAATLQNPPIPWQLEINCVLKQEIPKMIARNESLLKLKENEKENEKEKENNKCKSKNKAGSGSGTGFGSGSSSSSGSGSGSGSETSSESTQVQLPDFPLLPFCDEKEVTAAIAKLKAKHAKLCKPSQNQSPLRKWSCFTNFRRRSNEQLTEIASGTD